jgi:Kef-type K+ transport system membrane component KefB/Trk K+ transport system NAD-binding subunit
MDPRLEFLPLLLLLFLAFLAPPLLSRFRWLPVVVGEIVVGMLVGRSGLDIVRPDTTLEFLAEIGLAILMFLSGLEIDFSLISSRGAGRRLGPLTLAGISFVLTIALSGALAGHLVSRGLADDAMMVGLILSTTSLGVVLPVLKERGLSAGPFGQTLLLAALFADFVTMLLITVYVTLKARGLTLDILLVALLFVVALAVLRVGRSLLAKSPIETGLEEVIPVSSKTRLHAAIALLLAFVILAGLLGAEMILGAFLAGAVLSLLSGPRQRQLRESLDAIGFGFFIPVFFLMVGVKFDLPALLRSRRTWLLAPVLILAAYLIKIIPALLFRLRFSWKESLGGGLLLSSRLSLIIAAAGIGLRLGVIDGPTNAAFILVAAVTATVSPVLFNSLVPPQRVQGGGAIGIVGANDFSLQVARELEGQKEKVVFISPTPGAAGAAAATGFAVLSAASSSGGLRALDLPPLKSLLVLGTDDGHNARICREAGALGIPHIVVLVNDPARLQEFAALGVQTFAPALYRATLVALMARHPNLFSLMTTSRANHRIGELLVLDRALAGKAVKDLNLGGDILVLAIRRGHDTLIPHGETRLLEGDWITVYGDAGPVEDLRLRLGSP